MNEQAINLLEEVLNWEFPWEAVDNVRPETLACTISLMQPTRGSDQPHSIPGALRPVFLRFMC